MSWTKAPTWTSDASRLCKHFLVLLTRNHILAALCLLWTLQVCYHEVSVHCSLQASEGDLYSQKVM